jgi:hypothetical protein
LVGSRSMVIYLVWITNPPDLNVVSYICAPSESTLPPRVSGRPSTKKKVATKLLRTNTQKVMDYYNSNMRKLVFHDSWWLKGFDWTGKFPSTVGPLEGFRHILGKHFFTLSLNPHLFFFNWQVDFFLKALGLQELNLCTEKLDTAGTWERYVLPAGMNDYYNDGCVI